MKLLLVSSAFYPKVGGVEKVVEDLAENLSFRHDVCVLSSITELDKKNIFRVSSRIEDYKTFKLKRIWMNYPRNFVGAVVFPGRLFLSLVSLIFFARKFKPDLINLHFPDDVSLYMWVMTLFSKCPLIVNIHGNDLHVFSKQLDVFATEDDLLIVISGSGNSQNILEALYDTKYKTFGLLGMGGGEAINLVDHFILVPSDDYGKIEDEHLAIGHKVKELL